MSCTQTKPRSCEEMLEKEVQEKLDRLAHELHQTYKISVTGIMKPGFAVDEILSVSSKAKAGLLVVATEGAGKRPKTGYGKICAELLKQTDVPVICLPPGCALSDFKENSIKQTDNVPSGNLKGIESLSLFLSAFKSSSEIAAA